MISHPSLKNKNKDIIIIGDSFCLIRKFLLTLKHKWKDDKKRCQNFEGQQNKLNDTRTLLIEQFVDNVQRIFGYDFFKKTNELFKIKVYRNK